MFLEGQKCKLKESLNLPEIQVLAEVGTLASLYKQCLACHPSHFVRMAVQKDDIVWKVLDDVQVHLNKATASGVAFAVLVFVCMFPGQA